MLAEVLPEPLTQDEMRAAVAALAPGESFFLDAPITVEEYFELVDEDSATELIDGVVYMPTPPTEFHESLFIWLVKVLGQYVEVKGLGVVFGSRTGVRIGPTTFRVPDLLFVSREHLDRISTVGMTEAPDLVVEIVDSPKSRREAVEKQAKYQQIGVPELWVIDLPRREVRQFILAEGEYQRQPVEPEGEIDASVIPGFHLATAWLFQGPAFPNSFEVVHALLSEARGSE